MQIDGYTRLAAVVAHPIKHSISPFIHNFAFNSLQINGVYLAWDIGEEDLAETVANIRRYDMWGINLSMPYKRAVIPYLDSLSAEAELIGAVNTVVNDSGRLVGYNTDGIGFFHHLKKTFAFDVRQKALVLLGAGGAGTAIMAQAALYGAKEISVFVREKSLEKTAKKIASIKAKTACAIHVYAITDDLTLQSALDRADLLVNATSLGMDGVTSPLSEGIRLRQQLLVADAIYQPFETPFLIRAKESGLQTTNGLGMLLYQAAEAFKLWTGQEMPTDDIWASLVEKYQLTKEKS
ncbi:shikimate dehydrogenase [Streptococcus sp. DD12]|uniref:shikimate dehydrogenase n=1 Tax=Streptococcus sp. DD12 TaxID=1777880 RepID=UPI000793CB85|nr:shikimate dehydrogenase [Streptococcus sp. DD12]KXT76869.1 Shikimate/quinate 5-dehydrogenase I beta [Streptococcus sp. DD12]